MHACGHDMHVAILMGVAEVLSGMRAQLQGTVKFIFQPAEEGPPIGGAGPMIRDGALENPKVDAIFALHVGSGAARQRWAIAAAPSQASTDNFRIVVRGKQTHGAMPAAGVDPIIVSAQILLGLQTIVSRQVNLAEAPLVLTVGAIHAGLRENIIPDTRGDDRHRPRARAPRCARRCTRGSGARRPASPRPPARPPTSRSSRDIR